MPRRTIPFLPNQYYHFYNRGNNRQAVFFERNNYLYFLKGLKKYVVPHVDILVYSLMPTHYHVLGRVKQTSEVFKTSEVSDASAEVSKAMMRLGVSYTKAINKRFSRVGALFQGQFQGKPVQTYEHLLNLCFYIHANPVKDGLVALPEEWEYSNYLEWMGLREGTLVNREFIAENFGSPEEYRRLISNFIKTRYLPDDFRKYIREFELSVSNSDFRSLGDFGSLGNLDLLNCPLLAIFSSAKCPASAILKAHDYAKEIRNGEMGIISGFHAPAEKEVLEVLLKGTCPIVVVLGRRLEGARIPAAWKTEIEKGRMLVISPFKEYQAHVKKEMALKRNDLAARIAGRVLIVHASEGGGLQGQVERWELQGIDVKFLNDIERGEQNGYT